MRILCLGGCGYIGSRLRDELSKNHEIDCVDIGWFGINGDNNRKINYKINYDDLSLLFARSFDAVILTAAHSSVPMCNEDHYGAFNNNVNNFIKLVNKLGKEQKFIYASSSCVYLSTNGRDAVEGDQLTPNDMLSFSKTTADQYLQAFNPCEWYALRFGSVNGYSVNYRTDLMINAMTLNGMKNGYLQVSNGDNYRPILGMEDLVRGVCAIVESKEDRRGVYNMASFNTRIGDVGDKVGSILGCEVKNIDGTPSYDFTISSEKFKKAFNFEFKETVESIVDSIVVHKEELISKKFPARKVKERNV
jgi:nucleoside-diphosphate-sugar epimerase